MKKSKTRIAFCGTRGIPASYGGFETAVDEISSRLVQQGADCFVFCREYNLQKQMQQFEDRKLIYIKGSSSRKLDTFVSSINTGLYLIKNRKNFDYIFWFNNANIFGILLTLLARLPMSINTDGLEWRRAKWSWPFKLFYFFSSMIISLFCKHLISDSVSIQQYYKKTFLKKTHFIPYGAPVLRAIEQETRSSILKKYGLEENKFFLQITRFEPDNLPLEILKGFINSNLSKEGYKFVLIGYKDDTPYTVQIKGLEHHKGVFVLPANYDAEELAVLRSASFCYVHGNSVGGTNPALLEAMAYCKRIMAIEGPFSKEVLGEHGLLFQSLELPNFYRKSLAMEDQSPQMRNRLYSQYQWDAVAGSYLELSTQEPANYIKKIRQLDSVDLSV